jgi:hypothetical protein
MEQLWSTYGAVWSSLEQYGALGAAMEQHLRSISILLQVIASMEHFGFASNSHCRTAVDDDAPSSVAAEVVSGVVRLLLCPLLNLSSVSSRLLNSLALLWFFTAIVYSTKSRFHLSDLFSSLLL